MNTSTQPYYVESGNITPGRLALGVGVIVLASLILAYVYSLIIYHSPSVYLNAVVCICFGALLGLASNAAGRVAHVRSLAWRVIFGILAALLGYIFHWVAYLPLVLSDGMINPLFYLRNLAMLSHPEQSIDMIKLINLVGIWEIFGISNSGATGGIIWLVEAAIIVVLGIFSAYSAKVHPYSEAQSTFYKKYNFTGNFNIGSAALLTKAILDSGFAAFENLEPAGDRIWFTFHLYFLEGEKKQYLDVYKTDTVPDDNGKEEQETNLVIDNLALETEVARQLKDNYPNFQDKLSLF